ncbi:sensor histidine kinase [Actinoplanes awajinensis]|nr:HAMP domain-containing sensor histidine kinase [Actinoplanes awajinensis]
MRWHGLPDMRADRDARTRVVSRRSLLVLVLVATLGVAATLLAATALRGGERRLADRAADQQAASAAQAVTDGIRRYSDFLTSLSAALGAQQQLEAAEFQAITAPINRRILPGVAGVAYVVAATDPQIPAVQRFWRDRGVTDLTLQPGAVLGGRHLFIVLGRSADTLPIPLGEDMATAGAAGAAMRAAQTDRRVVISAAYPLRTDREVPAGQRQDGFVLAAAVRATAPAPDAGHLRGWLLLALRSGEFLHEAVGKVVGRTAAVDLTDAEAPGPAPIAGWRPAEAADPALAPRTLTITAPGRTWQLAISPTMRLIDHRGIRPSVIALIVGSVLTLLLTALTGSIATSRDRARHRVAVATAALRTDIARREAVEQQLRRREAELVGFAGVIAHDLRNPLARIAGYTDFLREEAARYLEEDHREYLERVHVCEQQMTVLLDDLLEYATADNRPLQARPVDLHALVEQVVRDRQESPGAREATVIVGALPTVDGDPTLLQQLFDNLIGNAVKYTPAGRAPFVRIGSRPEPGDRWRIEVSDNGIGIPEEQRESVFDAFTRAGGSEGFPGTGLGLAIVHRIVERHHGAIGVDPNPDQGSCFWIVIPAASATVAATAAV